MENQQFYMVYDILQEGYGTSLYFSLLSVLVVASILFFFTVSIVKRSAGERRIRDYLAIAGISVILVLFAFFAISDFRHKKVCLDWAKNSEFSVVQGIIRIGEQTSKRTSFSVRAVDFSLSKYDSTKCGCKSVIVADGSLVRISYREGQILKFEVVN